jgi:beta-mannosidase
MAPLRTAASITITDLSSTTPVGARRCQAGDLPTQVKPATRLAGADRTHRITTLGSCTFAAMAVFLAAFGACRLACAADALATLSLSGSDWRIHDDLDGTGVGRRLPTADCSASGWLPATVPGNVQADLEAVHVLKPLWYGLGDPRMHDAAGKDWWYRKDVAVPAGFAGKRLTLVFDGVDHQCDVWLNGVKVGANAGMYKRFRFDVTEAVQPGRMNRLAVRIARMPPELRSAVLSADAPGGPNVSAATNAVRARLKELKSPTNSAYDWAVAIYTLGIWKDVRLEATGPTRLDWVGVDAVLSESFSKAQIRVRLDVDSLAALPVKVAVQAVHNASRADGSITANLKPGINHVETSFPLALPALWWPAGQGDQPLYDVVVEARRADTGELLDRRQTRVGIREIRWGQTPGAPADFINPLKLVVNGRPVRQMGSNLTPPDSLFGRIDARGPRLLELARAAGINCLRLWGGGVILSETMYNRADELGIMLLHEFPLANCSPESDSEFLAHLEETAVNIVKQVRNHPCIVEWSGGNEMPWQNGADAPALHVLEKSVREHDTRFFRATEPAQGSGPHGSYTYVYHVKPAAYLTWLGAGGQNLYRRYNTSVEMRISEFGTNSPANLEVWHRTIPPESQWPLTNYNDPVLIRKNVFWGAVLKENWLHKEITEDLFGPVDGLEPLVRAGQFLGAEGLRYAMDALRRKGPALGGGFMSWNYNEPWPNGAGSYMVDYDGRTLMNYDFVKQALAPVSLSLKYDSLLYDPASGISIQLFLTSNAPAIARQIHWQWLARDRRGHIFDQKRGTATGIGPHEVKELATITLKPPKKTARGPLFVEMQLSDHLGRLLSERIHVFGVNDSTAPLGGLLRASLPDPDDDRPDPGMRDLPRRVAQTRVQVVAGQLHREKCQEVLEIMVKNNGPMTALFCEPHPLLNYRTDLFINNNHCFIPPGESRAITIRAALQPPCGVNLAQTGWRLSTWNAEDALVERSGDVLLAVGRQDAMCREFAGYGDGTKPDADFNTELTGRRPGAAALPYLLKGKSVVHFRFTVSAGQAAGPARLRLHTADQSAKVATEVAVTVNGRSFKAAMRAGLGMQDRAPPQLAFPATVEIAVPRGFLRPGGNLIDVRLGNDGWITWDAVDLVNNPEGVSSNVR